MKLNEAKSRAADNKAKERQKRAEEVYDLIQSIVVALVFCVLVFSFLFRIVEVRGSSMRPTLEMHDKVIMSKLFYRPKQGDIVVFKKASFKEDPLVKRIIATEGQIIDINFKEGKVFVDGEELQEPYIMEPTTGEAYDFNGPITVPKNCVFVMGDNRLHSTDSRYSQIGFVDNRYIMGKVYFTVFPVKNFGSPYI